DLERVVGAAGDEPEAVLIYIGPVAVDPDIRPARPVRLEVAVGILPEAGGHARPRLGDDQLAHLAADGTAVVAEHVGGHARRGAVEGARLDRGDGKRGDDAARYLRAPGVVDDGHRSAPHVLEDPAIRLSVPRLTRRPDDAKLGQLVLKRPLCAV